jgi:GDP-4-dehydro-6-deoxy-D-mannose reductase
MKKVLVTGATGFAGKYLIDHLTSLSDYSIIGTYVTSRPDEKERLKFVRLDLNSADDVNHCIATEVPDYIYHLAALTSPAESLENPARTITNNITAQVNILEAVKNSSKPDARILIVSSADVYGKVSQDNVPIDENTPLNPTNPYAVSKISQDFLGLQYHITHKMNIIRVRPFNHIGPGQEPKFVVAAFAKQIAEIEKGQKEPVVKVGNLEPKKDFSDVRDIVKGYQQVLEKGKVGDVYNMGSGESIKIEEILQKLLALSTVKIEIQKDDTLFRPTDTPDFVCDTRKTKSEIGWQTSISIDQSLKDTLDYWRKVL